MVSKVEFTLLTSHTCYQYNQSTKIHYLNQGHKIQSKTHTDKG